jgi:hypothetical protein
MKRALALLPLALIASACNDPHVVGLAGMWDAEFKILEPKTGVRPEWNYRGFLQLYATGNKFKMRLESNAQIVEMDGVWTITEDDKNLTLEFKEIKFDDRGGELRRPPNVQPLDPTAVRQAYSGKMPLKLDRQTNTLTGLEMDLGPLVVQHIFKKGKG